MIGTLNCYRSLSTFRNCYYTAKNIYLYKIKIKSYYLNRFFNKDYRYIFTRKITVRS